jgi:hypothetical protein
MFVIASPFKQMYLVYTAHSETTYNNIDMIYFSEHDLLNMAAEMIRDGASWSTMRSVAY